MILALEIIGLLFMAIVAGISIAALVIFIQMFSQIKYQNYLLAKLTHSINNIGNTVNSINNIPNNSVAQQDFVEESQIASMEEQSAIPHIIR